MQLSGRIAVITGAGSGIGRALAQRFSTAGATIVASDIDAAAAAETVTGRNGISIRSDVGCESDLVDLVKKTIAEFGQIDLFCSNAGVMVEGGPEIPDDRWRWIWSVNVMAHVYAARAVLPHMLARGAGYLLQTVSAAGLLSQIGSAPYSVTKHAALAFAEWLSITYGDRGIRVSALCPQGVRTPMLLGSDSDAARFLAGGALEPEQVAEETVRGIEEERFLILPHPEVAEYFQRKAGDYDRWLRAMRKLQASMASGG